MTRMREFSDLLSAKSHLMSVEVDLVREDSSRQGMGGITACATALIFPAVVSSPCIAATDAGPATPFAYFSTTTVESTRLRDTPAAGASVRETHLEAMLPLAMRAHSWTYTWAASFMHRYRTISFDARMPRADFNGDVHEVELGLHAWRTAGPHRRTLTLRPGIAVSSNVLKNPAALNSKALGGRFQWFEYIAQTASVNWLLGLGIDDRFGEYRAYPLAGLTWEPHPGTSLQLAYPDTRIIQRLTATTTLSLNVAPDGGEWRVHNKSMEKEADFHWENWRTTFAMRWTQPRGWGIELQGGMLFHQAMRVPLENGVTLATELDDAAFASFALQWRGQ